MVKKITTFLHKPSSLTSASIILMITLFLSNVLGVIRDRFLTQKIPTELLSTYYAAFRIPDLIFNILILGAIASAFIPIFTNLISRDKEEEAWQVASSVINIALIFLVGFSVILAIFMPYFMPFVVPGFDSEKLQTTINLARIMLLSPIFFGLSYILGGILNSYKRFLVYALAPLVYNLTIIAGTILFADRFSVTGVAIAVVVGALGHFLIQLPVALKLGYKINFKIHWGHWGVKRIGLLMLPRAFALGANQIMLLIFTGIASGLGGYSIAVYNLADNIQTMPIVVFGTSFATAIFPTLAEAVSKNQIGEFNFQINKYTRIILFFMIPIVVIFILLRMQIVRLLFGSGHFGWAQTIATANTLAYFSISLVFAGLIPLFSRGFYALHNTKTPMITTITGAIVSIVLGKLFSIKMGVEGLALGYSIGTIVTAIILYLMLRVKTQLDDELKLLNFISRVLFATLVMGISIQLVKVATALIVDMHRFWGIALQILFSLIIGFFVYYIFAKIFKLKEIDSITVLFQKYTRKNV